ncbi:tyrosine-type recombinase/integrase [Ruminococcus sp. 1001136sp1]|uniref:site-specific integrase n=1 Tax=unclassified Ruminococcus TaxID=2608920 RepID=UPI0011DD724B|nr:MULTISPECIES: site-specific integrase [unclassified Ruminococcus]MDB8773744.1 extracellular solute-binding protein [Ruminococcus sp. 1001136sp1]MDB8785045.1 extracellular solute-binding protein [Ruminococcus sp. 1001136sp1]
MMKKSVKKVMLQVMATAMAVSFGALVSAEDETISLTVWGAEEDQTLLKELIDNFQAAYPDQTFDIQIGVESESTAKDTVLTDVEAAADVYAFADDQITDLVKAGALLKLDDCAEVLQMAGKTLDDVLLVFPTNHKKNSTVRILKTPKTESSVRKIFLPKSVANMLVDWKVEQDEMKEILGDEYMDYNLVMASTFGLPLGDGAIRGPLKKLIEDYNLPPVVFHSFRHSSVTYKLKLNGGDIKAVQGDSGHAQVNMVTDVYSHILDDDRRKNAELFEEAFYEKKNLDPQMHVQQENNNATVADEVDLELLAKVLANPEMRALLNSLAKTMK